jgi:integrase
MNDTLTVLLKSGKLHAAEEGQVFYNGRGKPYRFLQTTREQAVRSAGFRALTFHDPRHAFTSRLVRVDVDLPTVKRVHLDLWYPGPPTKGGHRHGNLTVC